MNRSVLLFLVLGCPAPEHKNPPPIAGACATSPVCDGASSSSSGGGSSCDAFIGCMEQCDEGGCADRCASAVNADREDCETERCTHLADACALGSDSACEDVLSCAEPSETSSESSGSETTTI